MEHQSSAALKEAASGLVGEAFIITKDDFVKAYEALDEAHQTALHLRAAARHDVEDMRPHSSDVLALRERQVRQLKEALDVMANYHKPF